MTIFSCFQHYIAPWLLSKTDEKEPTFKENVENSLEKLSVAITGIEAVLAAQKNILEDLVAKTNTIQDNNNWRHESNTIKSEIISLKGLLLSS